jgi:hypothetical protein
MCFGGGGKERAYLDVTPAGIAVETLVHVILQRNGEAVHEGCARCDGVTVCYLRLLLFGDVNTLLGIVLA